MATEMPAVAADVGPLKGGWIPSSSSCKAYRDRSDESAMMISGRQIEFYESTCVIRGAKKSGASYSLKLLCEGEGETFQRSFVGKLNGNNTLVVKDGFTYKRCS
ncbi:hypothetical protein [Kaistia terrae]|uniref:DUF3617 family protein n=1 Tax=Kaistia terrae TaxID=537017 RepID=A0ABW0PYT1_9HYPH|nr:hypothetical protein [Kaistia terrae]MCX5580970.1 hypothetical protein [Kaistia terrae]